MIKVITGIFLCLMVHKLSFALPIVCGNDDIVCIDPEIGEYTYSVNLVLNRYSSLDEQIAVLQDSFDNHSSYQGCPQTLVFQGSFVGYSEEGAGRLDAEDDSYTFSWRFSENFYERQRDFLKWQHSRLERQTPNGPLTCVVQDQLSETDVIRLRDINCPEGYRGVSEPFKPGELIACIKEITPTKNRPTVCVGNPCDVSTGAKYAFSTDLRVGELSFKRTYNSFNLSDKGLGKGWHSNFLKRVSIGKNKYHVHVGNESGQAEFWRSRTSGWSHDIDSSYLFSIVNDEYELIHADGAKEYFSTESGLLLRKIYPNGKSVSYSYNSGFRLIKVEDSYQNSINFEYDDSDHISTIESSGGEQYRYEYDENDNLIAVIYPDLDDDPSNNPKRIFHYENSDLPNHLTGITDANGNRKASYAYDSQGRATLTEYAQTTNEVGQEGFQLDFQSN